MCIAVAVEFGYARQEAPFFEAGFFQKSAAGRIVFNDDGDGALKRGKYRPKNSV